MGKIEELLGLDKPFGEHAGFSKEFKESLDVLDNPFAENDFLEAYDSIVVHYTTWRVPLYISSKLLISLLDDSKFKKTLKRTMKDIYKPIQRDVKNVINDINYESKKSGVEKIKGSVKLGIELLDSSGNVIKSLKKFIELNEDKIRNSSNDKFCPHMSIGILYTLKTASIGRVKEPSPDLKRRVSEVCVAAIEKGLKPHIDKGDFSFSKSSASSKCSVEAGKDMSQAEFNKMTSSNILTESDLIDTDDVWLAETTTRSYELTIDEYDAVLESIKDNPENAAELLEYLEEVEIVESDELLEEKYTRRSKRRNRRRDARTMRKRRKVQINEISSDVVSVLEDEYDEKEIDIYGPKEIRKIARQLKTMINVPLYEVLGLSIIPMIGKMVGNSKKRRGTRYSKPHCLAVVDIRSKKIDRKDILSVLSSEFKTEELNGFDIKVEQLLNKKYMGKVRGKRNYKYTNLVVVLLVKGGLKNFGEATDVEDDESNGISDEDILLAFDELSDGVMTESVDDEFIESEGEFEMNRNEESRLETLEESMDTILDYLLEKKTAEEKADKLSRKQSKADDKAASKEDKAKAKKAVRDAKNMAGEIVGIAKDQAKGRSVDENDFSPKVQKRIDKAESKYASKMDKIAKRHDKKSDKLDRKRSKLSGSSTSETGLAIEECYNDTIENLYELLESVDSTSAYNDILDVINETTEFYEEILGEIDD